jgi:Leucine-rich repeat (LRR) protein
MIYLNLNQCLDIIGRRSVTECSIEQFDKKITIEFIHYHNDPTKDKYLIKSQIIFKINNEPVEISSLYGLTEIIRLKIMNIKKLVKLPYIEDSQQLKSLIIPLNNLIELPNNLPHSLEYLNCSNNKLQRIPNIHSNLTSLYCYNNHIDLLPFIPEHVKHLCFDDNPVQHLYYYNNSLEFRKKNNILYYFRYNYYLRKYGKKIFYSLLKKKMNRYKRELLENSAKITMNPKRIERLLNDYDDFDDI